VYRLGQAGMKVHVVPAVLVQDLLAPGPFRGGAARGPELPSFWITWSTGPSGTSPRLRCWRPGKVWVG